MRATQGLLARGFFGRSADEFMRRTNIALKLETIKGPAGPRDLYSFSDPTDVKDCIVMSDKLIGGLSTSHLDAVSAASPPTPPPAVNSSSSSDTTAPAAYARFHGNISTALPANWDKIKRTGYAGFRTPTPKPSAFGRTVWDIDMYGYLALRVKSDGRAYFVNVQTEGVEPSDLHQHRLFANRPGEWETVLINWNHFVRTNHGFVMEPQTEILRQKVTTVGIGLTDRVEGPFELCIEKIWATNGEGGEELESARRGAMGDEDAQAGAELGGLKNRKGQSIRW